MSVDSESFITEQSTAPPMSHRRILQTMVFITLAGGVTSIVFISWQFGAGVIFGGVLSVINYYWLKVSLKKIFAAAAAEGVKQRFLAVRYFSRYLTLGAILTIVFLTGAIPIIAVILGLSSFALAITVEGFIRLFSTLFKSGEL